MGSCDSLGFLHPSSFFARKCKCGVTPPHNNRTPPRNCCHPPPLHQTEGGRLVSFSLSLMARMFLHTFPLKSFFLPMKNSAELIRETSVLPFVFFKKRMFFSLRGRKIRVVKRRQFSKSVTEGGGRGRKKRSGKKRRHGKEEKNP